MGDDAGSVRDCGSQREGITKLFVQRAPKGRQVTWCRGPGSVRLGKSSASEADDRATFIRQRGYRATFTRQIGVGGWRQSDLANKEKHPGKPSFMVANKAWQMTTVSGAVAAGKKRLFKRIMAGPSFL